MGQLRVPERAHVTSIVWIGALVMDYGHLLEHIGTCNAEHLRSVVLPAAERRAAHAHELALVRAAGGRSRRPPLARRVGGYLVQLGEWLRAGPPPVPAGPKP
jgi:hypothetical protein